MREKLKTLAKWCNVSILPEEEDLMIGGVQTDSRKVKRGDLFVAICGENSDGHDYAASAVANGASAVLVSKPVEVDAPRLLTDDTRRAYGAIASGYRAALGVKVIAVTGSVGKTTTKEMIASILATSYPTTKSEGNHNNDLGLPMSILETPADTRCAVWELGMNHFGEMSYLSSVARPNVAVITNIGTAHIANLGSREGILKAKLEILDGMNENGLLVLNGDEKLLWEQRERFSQKTLFFGIKNPECDVLAEDLRQIDGGMSFRVRGKGHDFELFLPVEGEHNVMNALAAITVALHLSVRPEKIQAALSAFHNTGMRQQITHHNGVTIIADCYNAGPESMAASLCMLRNHPANGRRIAVLGDMLELGNRSAAEHYRIGRTAVQNADIILAYGANADRVISGAITGGMNPKNCRRFSSHQEMAETIAAIAKPGDVLLFKGSRGMRMENVMHLYVQMTQAG